MICNVVLVSAVQPTESVIYIYVYVYMCVYLYLYIINL